MNIGNFIGSWYIQWRDGVEGHGLQQGWTLKVGTGSEYGDCPPFLSDDYRVCVGFSMINQDGKVELSTVPVEKGLQAPGYRQPDQSMALFLIDHQLCWRGDLGVVLDG